MFEGSVKKMAEISFPQAIAILKEKYKEARDSKYVSKPISWALENLIPHEKRDEYRIISNEPEGA